MMDAERLSKLSDNALETADKLRDNCQNMLTKTYIIVNKIGVKA